MKITKTQLKKIIKEELNELGPMDKAAPHEEGPWADIDNAIKMLEAEEDTTGTLVYVIERLYAALEKLGGGGGSWRYTGQGEPKLEQSTGENIK